MPERSSYPEGAPCWADVNAADAVAAGRFYRGVFGWDLEDMGEQYGHYTIATVDGRTVAAITPPPPGGEDAPSMWTVYLKSDDAASTASAVEKAGGSIVMPTMEVPGQGVMGLVADPTGAIFGIWQPGGHTGAQLFGENGAINWAEAHTPDGPAADTFYTTVFPLTGEPIEGGGIDFTVLKSGDDMVGGRYSEPGLDPHWRVYFQVADVDAAVANVREGSGTVLSEPEDTPYGRMAVVADPNGASFALMTPPPR
ncbi:MAG TPA: VOC family protein [Micromonosporaceae bacterium]|jgi:hypothetical protein